MSYTYAQLEQLWISAGGSRAAAPVAAAIAMAESSGNPDATDYDSNGTVDRGLWQINSIHGAQSTFSVAQNAKAAVAISGNGSNWTPWTTFNSGAYRQYLNSSATPAAAHTTAKTTTASSPNGGTDSNNSASDSGGDSPSMAATLTSTQNTTDNTSAHPIFRQILFAFIGVAVLALVASWNARLGKALLALMTGFLITWFLLHDDWVASAINGVSGNSGGGSGGSGGSSGGSSSQQGAGSFGGGSQALPGDPCAAVPPGWSYVKCRLAQLGRL